MTVAASSRASSADACFDIQVDDFTKVESDTALRHCKLGKPASVTEVNFVLCGYTFIWAATSQKLLDWNTFIEDIVKNIRCSFFLKMWYTISNDIIYKRLSLSASVNSVSTGSM